MAPVIDRIARSPLQSGGKCGKLLKVIAVTGNQFLRYTVRAHQTPFIMIGAEPELRNGTEGYILGNLLNGNMAMIIHNRHMLCVLMVQYDSTFRIKKKVSVHEFHAVTSFLRIRACSYLHHPNTFEPLFQ